MLDTSHVDIIHVYSGAVTSYDKQRSATGHLLLSQNKKGRLKDKSLNSSYSGHSRIIRVDKWCKVSGKYRFNC